MTNAVAVERESGDRRPRSATVVALLSLSHTQRRLAHQYKNWALEAERAGKLLDYRKWKVESDRCWSGALWHLHQARTWIARNA